MTKAQIDHQTLFLRMAVAGGWSNRLDFSTGSPLTLSCPEAIWQTCPELFLGRNNVCPYEKTKSVSLDIILHFRQMSKEWCAKFIPCLDSDSHRQ